MLDGGLTLGPVVDGDLIPLPTPEALAAGIGADKELILGTTDHEFNMVLAGAGEALAGVPAAGVLGAVGADPEVIEAYVADHPGLGTARPRGPVRHRPDVPGAGAGPRRAPCGLSRRPPGCTALPGARRPLAVPATAWTCRSCLTVSAASGSRRWPVLEPPQALADDVHSSAVSFIATGDPGWPEWNEAARAVRVYDLPTTVVADGYADARALLPERIA